MNAVTTSTMGGPYMIALIPRCRSPVVTSQIQYSCQVDCAARLIFGGTRASSKSRNPHTCLVVWRTYVLERCVFLVQSEHYLMMRSALYEVGVTLFQT